MKMFEICCNDSLDPAWWDMTKFDVFIYYIWARFNHRTLGFFDDEPYKLERVWTRGGMYREFSKFTYLGIHHMIDQLKNYNCCNLNSRKDTEKNG